jgi:hypothetical protein
MGGYKRIFPPYDEAVEEKYNKLYEVALQIHREDNETRKKLLSDEKKKTETKDDSKKKNEKTNKAEF